MFSARRLGIVFLGLVPFVFSAPALAADTMIDLVRELGAQPKGACQSKAGAVGKTKAGGSRRARKQRRSARHAERKLRRGRGGRPRWVAARARLTKAARGSGRIDVIDMDGPVTVDDRPAIESKRDW